MKKRWYLGIASLIALTTLSSCVVGGSSSQSTNESASESANDEIYAVYEAYKANGGELSYEDWLASIKGEKGDKGDKGDKRDKGDRKVYKKIIPMILKIRDSSDKRSSKG